MGKGRGESTRLGGGEGVQSLEALSEELEECFGELELAKEGFGIFFFFFFFCVWRLKFLEEKSKRYKRNEG